MKTIYNGDKMIEVYLMPNGLYRWFLISEQAIVIVIGTDHETDHKADADAKIYRNAFKALAKEIDCYRHILF